MTPTIIKPAMTTTPLDQREIALENPLKEQTADARQAKNHLDDDRRIHHHHQIDPTSVKTESAHF